MYQGLGLPEMGLETIIEKINYLIMHYGTNTLPGQHINILMENIQLELGLSTQFFKLPFSIYGSQVTPCWLYRIWREISQMSSIKIDCCNIMLPPPPRQYDSFLMVFKKIHTTQQADISKNREFRKKSEK